MSKTQNRYEMLVYGEFIVGLSMKISKREFERQLNYFKEEVKKQRECNSSDDDSDEDGMINDIVVDVDETEGYTETSYRICLDDCGIANVILSEKALKDGYVWK